MDFMKSLFVAASGLKAQSGRMRVIAENIANADSTARTPGGDPYRRRVATFESVFDNKMQANKVAIGPVEEDRSAFNLRFNPSHPAADATGYVKMPNVDRLVEAVDMREAQRSYEANLNVITSTRTMLARTLDILNN
ncbi:MAG: flagellar basal body rod protein FlgC [Pseudomonadota bacterium]